MDLFGEVVAEIKKLASEVWDTKEIKPEYDLRDDIGLDSLDFFEICISLSDKYEYDYTAVAGAVPEPVTVQAIVDTIEKYRGTGK